MESFPNRTTFDDGDVTDGTTDLDQSPDTHAQGNPFEADGSVTGQPARDGGVRQKAGGMLHGVKDRAERVSETVRSKVSNASNYVKNAQAADMWGDVKELARRNPGASMLAVAAIGFAIGRSTSSRQSR